MKKKITEDSKEKPEDESKDELESKPKEAEDEVHDTEVVDVDNTNLPEKKETLDVVSKICTDEEFNKENLFIEKNVSDKIVDFKISRRGHLGNLVYMLPLDLPNPWDISVSQEINKFFSNEYKKSKCIRNRKKFIPSILKFIEDIKEKNQNYYFTHAKRKELYDFYNDPPSDSPFVNEEADKLAERDYKIYLIELKNELNEESLEKNADEDEKNYIIRLENWVKKYYIPLEENTIEFEPLGYGGYGGFTNTFWDKVKDQIRKTKIVSPVPLYVELPKEYWEFLAKHIDKFRNSGE